ncbi:MAG: cation transporter [Candidatus Parcubacteria bacterium]|nr:cation transporter [Candidatus Parcubacteria bacterium]
MHDHCHSPPKKHSHSHKQSRELNLYLLAFALSLFAGIVEIAVRYLLSGSVSLFGDAAHGISDGSTYGLLALVLVICKYHPEQELIWTKVAVWFSFGLLFLGDYLVLCEAMERFLIPKEVLGGWTFITAMFSFGLNLFVVWMLQKIPKEEHNIRHDSMSFHALSDMIVSIGVIGSSLIIIVTDWYAADWIMAFVIAFYLLFLLCVLAIRIVRGDWKIGHDHNKECNHHHE